MKLKIFYTVIILSGVTLLTAAQNSMTISAEPRMMEHLSRGLIAVRIPGDSVFISWRLLGTEPEDIAFNLYRQSGNSKAIKLNKKPITESTCFTDGTANLNIENTYFVRAIIRGKELPSDKPYTLRADTPVQQYITVPLRTPPGYSQ